MFSCSLQKSSKLIVASSSNIRFPFRPGGRYDEARVGPISWGGRFRAVRLRFGRRYASSSQAWCPLDWVVEAGGLLLWYRFMMHVWLGPDLYRPNVCGQVFHALIDTSFLPKRVYSVLESWGPAVVMMRDFVQQLSPALTDSPAKEFCLKQTQI